MCDRLGRPTPDVPKRVKKLPRADVVILKAQRYLDSHTVLAENLGRRLNAYCCFTADHFQDLMEVIGYDDSKYNCEEFHRRLERELTHYIRQEEPTMAPYDDNQKPTQEDSRCIADFTRGVETRTFVFGKDITDLSEEDLLCGITHAQNEILRLKAFTASKKIKKRLKGLGTGIKALIAQLDKDEEE